MRIQFMLVLTLLLNLSFTARAQQPRSIGRVGVDVSGNDQETTTLATSYINRELRALGDVTLSDSADRDATFYIGIVVIADRTTSGTPLGYSFGVVMYRRLSTTYLRTALQHYKVEQSAINELLSVYRYSYARPTHWLGVSGNDSMENMCKQIVAKFDVENLQPERMRLSKLKGN